MIDFRGRVSDMYKYRYLLRRLFSHDYSRISKRVLFLLKNMLCFAWACAILFQDKTLREVQL